MRRLAVTIVLIVASACGGGATPKSAATFDAAACQDWETDAQFVATAEAIRTVSDEDFMARYRQQGYFTDSSGNRRDRPANCPTPTPTREFECTAEEIAGRSPGC